MKISIIIPVYNEEDYIVKCLDSIKMQTITPHEVIVVDNNSTDSSAKLVSEFEGVTLLHETTLQGPGYARKKGFEAATGEIFARIDADTVLSKDWLERVQNAFETGSVAAISSTTSFYDVPFSPLWKIVLRLYFFEWNSLICGVRPLFGSNMAIRKTVYEKIESQLSGSDEIWEDLEIALLIRDQNIRTVNLPATISMRSAFVRAKDMAKYMKRWKTTYEVHDYHRGIIGSQLGLYMVVFWGPLIYLLTRNEPSLPRKD